MSIYDCAENQIENSGNKEPKNFVAGLTPRDDGRTIHRRVIFFYTLFFSGIRVQAGVYTEVRDRREVVAREVWGRRIVQRAAGGRVGLRRQRIGVAAEVALVE
jgi:hypothetical protein